MTVLLYLLMAGPLQAGGADKAQGPYFVIEVIDDATGRGVPLVELRTVGGISHWTDSNGLVAFNEPGLMDQRVFFHVRSHGYEFPKDGFGIRGRALETKPGTRATLRIQRINIAERLYRVTGGGIYRDSVLAGQAAPLAHPVVNGLVLGSDSVANVVFGGKLYWFWGDTNRPAYPLGNFHVPGATSQLPAEGGLDPAVGVNLNYFVDEQGFARPTCKMAGDGPTWIDGLLALDDSQGRERLFAAYAKIRAPMTVYRRGLAEFDPQEQQFEHLADLDLHAPVLPGGHPFKHTEAGTDYYYFAKRYPLVRVPAEVAALTQLDRYQAFTCLKQGSRTDEAKIDRAPDGRLRYAWKTNTPAVGPEEQEKLVRSGAIKPHEALLQLRDRDTGKPVSAHHGSVYWNAYRQRWVMITTQLYGSSLLGEVWYAEADSPVGPWVYAVKVVSHDNYSFYNPKQHPMFDEQQGRTIYFEGTYTHTFSGNPVATPRYDYNQIMYRLDLADPRMALPVAIYRSAGNGPEQYRTLEHDPPAAFRDIAFFGLDRPIDGALAVYAQATTGEHVRLRVASPDAGSSGEPVFYALPAEMPEPPATTEPLYEFVHNSGARVYRTERDWREAGYTRQEQPVCLVWHNPVQIVVGDTQ